MRKLAVVTAVILGTGTIGATGAAATDAVDFTSTLMLDNCSGAVVQLPQSKPEDPANAMTNGHCAGDIIKPTGTVADVPSDRSFTLLDGAGEQLSTLHAKRIIYGTRVDTDIALYELTSTYGDIEKNGKTKVLPLSADHPKAKTPIKVVSGYWTTI